MRITAKVDYALRAGAELAAAQAGADRERALVKGDALATAQGIPGRFLEGILGDLRRAGIVGSQRGSDGGYWLAKPAEQVSVADIIRAVEGPLADVHGEAPEQVTYQGPAREVQRVWIATRVALREVLEETSLAAIAAADLPARVIELADRPGGWSRR
ncbi:MAG: RrF2 family transcriptional regulator [Microthrixaceae bacterium]